MGAMIVIQSLEPHIKQHNQKELGSVPASRKRREVLWQNILTLIQLGCAMLRMDDGERVGV